MHNVENKYWQKLSHLPLQCINITYNDGKEEEKSETAWEVNFGVKNKSRLLYPYETVTLTCMSITCPYNDLILPALSTSLILLNWPVLWSSLWTRVPALIPRSRLQLPAKVRCQSWQRSKVWNFRPELYRGWYCWFNRNIPTISRGTLCKKPQRKLASIISFCGHTFSATQKGWVNSAPGRVGWVSEMAGDLN